jgi:Holliday junction resolvase RusA-like endonuclease
MIYALGVNPEPWAVPPLSAVRTKSGKYIVRAGRDHGMFAYQEAVRDQLRALGAVMLEPPYRLEFWFWRNEATYRSTAGRNISRNHADSTNMQKATEDALQGVLIDNDRNVHSISSQIVQSGPKVTPGVVISAQTLLWPLALDDSVLEAYEKIKNQPFKLDFPTENTW